MTDDCLSQGDVVVVVVIHLRGEARAARIKKNKVGSLRLIIYYALLPENPYGHERLLPRRQKETLLSLSDSLIKFASEKNSRCQQHLRAQLLPLHIPQW